MSRQYPAPVDQTQIAEQKNCPALLAVQCFRMRSLSHTSRRLSKPSRPNSLRSNCFPSLPLQQSLHCAVRQRLIRSTPPATARNTERLISRSASDDAPAGMLARHHLVLSKAVLRPEREARTNGVGRARGVRTATCYDQKSDGEHRSHWHPTVTLGEALTVAHRGSCFQRWRANVLQKTKLVRKGPHVDRPLP